jgi:hypothetical protein
MSILFCELLLSMCCLLSSCFLESLVFCPSFLICDVRRFGNERFRCLRHGGAPLGWSRWEHSSWTSSVVASWAVFGWDTVDANVGGPKNRRESPDTRTTRFNVQFAKDRETKNLQKTTLASKVVNLFTRAHTPPFIRRRRAFLHFENTLECKEYS